MSGKKLLGGAASAIFGYLWVTGLQRERAGQQYPVTTLDSKQQPFDSKNVPEDVHRRLANARKVVVPVHGYQPKSWRWATVFQPNRTPPYGNYDGVAFSTEMTRGIAAALGSELPDDVAVVYPIWPSNELLYVPQVRRQAGVTGQALAASLENVMDEAPDAEIELLAHSAGGIVAQKALVELNRRGRDLSRVRQTLLDVDVESASLAAGDYAEVAKKVHSTRVVFDPNDRALGVSQFVRNKTPLGLCYDPTKAELRPNDIPGKVAEEGLEGVDGEKLLGKDGPGDAAKGVVEAIPVSLPGVLKHTGFTDYSNLDGESRERMRALFKSLVEPFPKK